MGILERRRSAWAQEKRGLYAGGRPNDEAKAIHRRYVSSKALRLIPFSAVLEINGRTSGRAIKFPLVTIRFRGDWYL